jgi:hypothetical protein
MTSMHLAQISIARLLHPQDDQRVAACMDNLDAVKAAIGKTARCA